MSIRLFATGGTFDKDYDFINGRLYFKETQVPEMLQLGRCSVHVDVRTLMMIDSLDMTEEDREIILRNCLACEENKIVITHGTDTMVQTAHIIGKAGIEGKTIVLTGAMIPYRFGSSDGFFNMGSALAFVQTLPAGVYIAMNGRFFQWNNCQKNRQTGMFEEIVKG